MYMSFLISLGYCKFQYLEKNKIISYKFENLKIIKKIFFKFYMG